MQYTICRTLSQRSAFSEILNLVQRDAQITFGYDSEKDSLTISVTDTNQPEIKINMQADVKLFLTESDTNLGIAVGLTTDKFLEARRK